MLRHRAVRRAFSRRINLQTHLLVSLRRLARHTKIVHLCCCGHFKTRKFSKSTRIGLTLHGSLVCCIAVAARPAWGRGHRGRIARDTPCVSFALSACSAGAVVLCRRSNTRCLLAAAASPRSGVLAATASVSRAVRCTCRWCGARNTPCAVAALAARPMDAAFFSGPCSSLDEESSAVTASSGGTSAAAVTARPAVRRTRHERPPRDTLYTAAVTATCPAGAVIFNSGSLFAGGSGPAAAPSGGALAAAAAGSRAKGCSPRGRGARDTPCAVSAFAFYPTHSAVFFHRCHSLAGATPLLPRLLLRLPAAPPC